MWILLALSACICMFIGDVCWSANITTPLHYMDNIVRIPLVASTPWTPQDLWRCSVVYIFVVWHGPLYCWKTPLISGDTVCYECSWPKSMLGYVLHSRVTSTWMPEPKVCQQNIAQNMPIYIKLHWSLFQTDCYCWRQLVTGHLNVTQINMSHSDAPSRRLSRHLSPIYPPLLMPGTPAMRMDMIWVVPNHF